MAELNNHGVESFRRLWYGAVPELKATKELEVMSLDEVRASITKAAGIGRLLLRVRSFLLPRRRRQ